MTRQSLLIGAVVAAAVLFAAGSALEAWWEDMRSVSGMKYRAWILRCPAYLHRFAAAMSMRLSGYPLHRPYMLNLVLKIYKTSTGAPSRPKNHGEARQCLCFNIKCHFEPKVRNLLCLVSAKADFSPDKAGFEMTCDDGCLYARFVLAASYDCPPP